MPCKNNINHQIKHDVKHDAYYCVECNDWLEPPCHDNGCPYCRNRPARPIATPKSETPPPIPFTPCGA